MLKFPNLCFCYSFIYVPMYFMLIISIIVIDNKFYFVLWATLSNKKLEVCPSVMILMV